MHDDIEKYAVQSAAFKESPSLPHNLATSSSLHLHHHAVNILYLYILCIKSQLIKAQLSVT